MSEKISICVDPDILNVDKFHKWGESHLSNFIEYDKMPFNYFLPYLFKYSGMITANHRPMPSETQKKRFSLLSYIPSIDVKFLDNPIKLEHFIKEVYLYEEVKQNFMRINSKYSLELFHRRHKMLLRLHNPINQKKLGRIVCDPGKEISFIKIKWLYFTLFLQSFDTKVSIGRHYSILQRVLREINRIISCSERKSMQQIIKSFYDGRVPLSVPIGYIRDFALTYDITFILEQSYLSLYLISIKLMRNIKGES